MDLAFLSKLLFLNGNVVSKKSIQVWFFLLRKKVLKFLSVRKSNYPEKEMIDPNCGNCSKGRLLLSLKHSISSFAWIIGFCFCEI